MDKNHFSSKKEVFQIGEVAKCCGVDRQTILFYERKGLISPTIQNDSSGYRYYSIEAIGNLLLILKLRDTGLSIREIKNFLQNSDDAAERTINRMQEMYDALKTGIEELQLMLLKKNEYVVTQSWLPEMVCYSKEFICQGIDEAMKNVYQTFCEAIKNGAIIRKSSRIYAEFPDELGESIKLDNFRMKVFLPIYKPLSDNCVCLPKTSGLAVYHKGAYSDIGAAYQALWAYVEQHKIVPCGNVRECYIQGSFDNLVNEESFMTRLFLPTKS